MNRHGISCALRNAAVVTVLGFAIACTPLTKNHGYIPEEQDLSRIVVGQDSRDSVLTLVGPPTSGGVLDGSGYHYVASKFRTIGAFAPEETERQVVAITFDSAGIVTNIERFGLDDGQVVVLSRRVTETGVQDSTFIRQLLGSLGRIDAGQFLGNGG